MALICWDLDETLGYFRPLADELVAQLRAEQRGLLGKLGERILGIVRSQEQAAERVGPPVSLRGGIGEVLRGLGAAGFQQVVTTGSFEAYAQLALERTGLLGHFAEVYGRERVWDGRGKVYQQVLDDQGVAPEEVLIVGDSFKRDRASDHQDVVLVCQEDGLELPAGPLLPVIRALGAEGNFAAGFARAHAEAEPRAMTRVGTFAEVEAALGYWGDYRRGERTPVVSALRLRPGD